MKFLIVGYRLFKQRIKKRIMIRREDFHNLERDVKESVNEVFDYGKKNEKNENDYILFLARGYYDKSVDKTRFSPWQVDRQAEERADRHRVDFLLEYVNSQYNFRAENTQDSKFSLTIELMIYTHLWESQHNLVKFKRLADLCNSNDYDWNVSFPMDSKYPFIKNKIREIFNTHNLKIYSVINDCYKSQLRNAFAHSLYHFGIGGNSIVLENDDDNHNIIKRLSFDEWTQIFLKSALLQMYFHNKFSEEIESLEDGKQYEVIMEYEDERKIGLISYDHEGKHFSAMFKQ